MNVNCFKKERGFYFTLVLALYFYHCIFDLKKKTLTFYFTLVLALYFYHCIFDVTLSLQAGLNRK